LLTTLQSFLFVAPILLFSVIAHEYAHGYAALRQGDATAYHLGRLTWNPVKHIDPFMTILMPLALWILSHGSVILGGAKPVPVDPRNYRDYRRGDIIVSLAGVGANFVVALGCTLLIAVAGVLGRLAPPLRDIVAILQIMLSYGVLLNFALIAFNLIPIPPLDGSHVMKYLLPSAWSVRYEQIGRYGVVILIVLLYFGPAFFSIWMRPARALTGLLLGAVGPLVMPNAVRWAP
jgi:Zn-dependent protease